MPDDTVEFRKALRVLKEAGYSYGQIERLEIVNAVKQEDWQKFRVSMKGKSTGEKILMLTQWYGEHFGEHDAWVQVTNYLNALKRGGQLV